MRTDVLFLLVFGAPIPGLYSIEAMETLPDQTLIIQQIGTGKLQAAERASILQDVI